MITTTKPTFERVKIFFRSWGLTPDDEEHTITDVNEMCLLRMKVDAVVLFGKSFGDFVMKECVLEEGQYHLGPTKWSELEKDWKKFGSN